MSNSYKEALEAAGAEILAFESFGSYQGDWWCLCKYKGQIGWVNGSYGSCSGCDAFEYEFCMCDSDDNPEYQERLKEFGKGYLEGALISQEKAIEMASEDMDWSDGCKEMVDFIKKSWRITADE